MDITHKNRKKLWLAGAIVVLLYFAPSALRSWRQAAYLRQQQQAREEAAWAARDAAAKAAASRAASTAWMGNFAGGWAGQQAQVSHELCQLALELRGKDQGEIEGYARLACYPMPSYYPGQPKVDPGTAFLKAFTPLSAVLTGSPGSNGAIPFHIDKVIGTSVDGCTLTSFTVTPFGNDELAAEWQKDSCGSGQVVLQRVRK